MRCVLLAAAVMAAAPAAQAAVITYDINANFAVRTNPGGNVNQPSPLGGLLNGFITVDTSLTDNAAILDFEFTSFLPNFLGDPSRSVDYDFNGPDDIFSFDSATGAFSTTSDVTGLFPNTNISVVLTRSRLDLILDSIGDDPLGVTGSELYRNCTAFFTINGLSNGCNGILGNNGGLDTLADARPSGGQGAGGGNAGGGAGGGNGGMNMGGGQGNAGGGSVPVPEPGSIALLLGGLLSLAGLRRKAA
ncbi:MAG: PEP-CTERM sorting domain-containing protein [Pseudomonadota bacterium]